MGMKRRIGQRRLHASLADGFESGDRGAWDASAA
jgi:hypothetical protein